MVLLSNLVQRNEQIRRNNQLEKEAKEKGEEMVKTNIQKSVNTLIADRIEEQVPIVMKKILKRKPKEIEFERNNVDVDPNHVRRTKKSKNRSYVQNTWNNGKHHHQHSNSNFHNSERSNATPTPIQSKNWKGEKKFPNPQYSKEKVQHQLPMNSNSKSRVVIKKNNNVNQRTPFIPRS